MKLHTTTVNLFYFFSVFLLAFIAQPINDASWFWESANAFGFVAFVCLLLLCINGRDNKGHFVIHRWLGIAVFITCVIHVLCFLLGDPLLIEYLKPGTPLHMAFGVVAFILVGLLSISSLKVFRNHFYLNAKKLQKHHRYLFMGLVLFSALHIIFSENYFANKAPTVLLCLLIVLVFLISTSSKAGHVFEASILLVSSLSALTIFILLRGFSF